MCEQRRLRVSLSSVAPQTQNDKPEEEGTLSLDGKLEVPFRTIHPDDVDALQRFHQRPGERTIYLRFFGSMKELSEEKAEYFASTDGSTKWPSSRWTPKIHTSSSPSYATTASQRTKRPCTRLWWRIVGKSTG